MISFALILMTLPSRVAAARARRGESSTGLAVSSTDENDVTAFVSNADPRKPGAWQKRLHNELRPLLRNSLTQRQNVGSNNQEH
jgi:hypothetical protein